MPRLRLLTQLEYPGASRRGSVTLPCCFLGVRRPGQVYTLSRALHWIWHAVFWTTWTSERTYSSVGWVPGYVLACTEQKFTFFWILIHENSLPVFGCYGPRVCVDSAHLSLPLVPSVVILFVNCWFKSSVHVSVGGLLKVCLCSSHLWSSQCPPNTILFFPWDILILAICSKSSCMLSQCCIAC